MPLFIKRAFTIGLVLLLANITCTAVFGSAIFAKPVNPKSVNTKPLKGIWTGTLVDKTCYAHAAKIHDMSLLDGHEKTCIEKCAKDGNTLGLLVDSNYFAFDHSGERLAWKVLTNSKLTTDIHVIVQGTLRESTISIRSIKEVQK